MSLSVLAATENEVTSGATDACTISGSTGNLAVIFSRQGTNNTTNMTVTDSSGGSNTWTQTSSGYVSSSSTARAAMFYSVLSANVTSITANWTGTSGRISAVAYIISGNASSSPADSSVNAQTSTASLSITSGSLTTTNANDILLFGVSTGTNNTSYTPGTGFAIQSGGSGNRAVMSYEIVSSTQSNLTTTMGFGNSSSSIVTIFAAFKAASGGPSILYSLPLLGAGPA